MKRTLNKFEYYKEIAFIGLEDKNKNIVSWTVIDRNDLIKALGKRWHLDHKGYVRSSDTKNKVYLHNYLLSIKHSYKREIDHINRNPLDNRRNNLRIVPHNKNIYNRGMLKSNTSGITGICFESSRKKWRVTYRGKFYGRYSSINEAKNILDLIVKE